MEARRIWRDRLNDPGFRDSILSMMRGEFVRLPWKRIVAYIPLADEFDFINVLLKSELPVYLPRITEIPQMEFRLFTDHDPDRLERGHYGILQPRAEAPQLEMPLSSEDMVIVPSLAVNRDGRRLGRGGGFYDRWKEYLERARVLSLLPEELVDLDFPSENHDLRLNAVITERSIVDYMKRYAF